MVRSYESVRIGAKKDSAMWLKASRTLKKEDRSTGGDVLNAHGDDERAREEKRRSHD